MMMKITLMSLFVITIFFTSCSFQNKSEKVYNQGINIIPMPNQMEVTDGKFFSLNNDTKFVAESDETKKIGELFSKIINQSTDLNISVVDTQKSNCILLRIDPDMNLKNEGYTLSVSSERVEISGKTAAGVFYGMQSFMQLLPAEIESQAFVADIEWNVPCVEISDEPRFDYRGVHLDPSRHFVDVDFIKKQIDVWAMYKINTLHWHLTDDQGWRIEIKKYPKLTQIGSERVDGEGTKYGGFYTQEEAREIVAYAAERFITVIPELEVPGHELAAISAYPELSCRGDSVTSRIIWGVEDIVMCPGKELMFDFLQDVIDEMVEIFPSTYFHIGGDECPKSEWEKCQLCQARIKAEGLDKDPIHKPEDGLQSYVVKRVEDMLEKHGRKIIGWDEILEGGIDSTATIMSWRGEFGGIAASLKGHDVIMTPSSEGMYIDFYQGDSKIEPVTIGGSSSLEKVYSYNPVPDTLLKLGKDAFIKGVQCNLWAEYLYTPELREYQYYPRVMALSEIAWSNMDSKNYKDFCRRLNNAYVRLDMHNINYHIPQPEQPNGSCNFVAFVDSAILEFTTSRPIKMVYSVDGSTLTPNSTEYSKPIVLKENTTLKIASVLPSGKMSREREILIEKQSYSSSVQIADTAAGLRMHNVSGMFLNVNELESKQDNKEMRDTIISKLIDIRSVTNFGEKNFGFMNYASIAEGYINILEDGVYYFSTDNEEFWIDGVKLIDNSGEVKRFSRKDKSVALGKGLHPIRIVYLGHIIGGWPSVWNDGKVEMRKCDEKNFKNIDALLVIKK